MMSSDYTVQNRSVFVANMFRFDRIDSALDQEAYVIVYNHELESTTGALFHHGDWNKRTFKANQEVLTAIENSALGVYFPLIGIPERPSGPLKDLEEHPQGDVYQRVVRRFGI